MDTHQFNSLDAEKAKTHLRHCCHSEKWVTTMLSARPFSDKSSLIETHRTIWSTLNADDYLEAFLAHPMIGDIDTLRQKYAATKDLSTQEQAGVSGASEETLKRLSELNQQYYEKFGFIFIICATAKSADEMLLALEDRINNGRDSEIANAAAEQSKITEIRIHQLLEKGV